MNMTTSPLSTVIGVFADHNQANMAIDELRRTNFGYDRIRVVERGTGGVFDTLKGMFTGQGSVASNAADNLVKMGMPEHDAEYYQHELDADHVLVLMNADDRPEEAFGIMRHNGAFDINSRLRMAPTNGSVETADRNGSPMAANPDGTLATPYANGSNVAPNAEATPVAPYAGDSRMAPNPDAVPVVPYSSASQEAYNRSDTAPRGSLRNVPPSAPDPDAPPAATYRSSDDNALPATGSPEDLEETT